MFIRGTDGKMYIIERKNCRDDATYYRKLYNIKQRYCSKYNCIMQIPKDLYNETNKNEFKFLEASEDKEY
jgi:hypothetical protein